MMGGINWLWLNIAISTRDVEEPKFPQRHAVATMPGDCAFGGKAFKVADKEHPEVDAGRNRRPADFGEIRSAFQLQPGVEIVIVEETVETRVKRVSASGRQVAGGYPEWLLLGFLAFPNGHGDPLFGYSFPHLTRSTVWLNCFVWG